MEEAEDAETTNPTVLIYNKQEEFASIDGVKTVSEGKGKLFTCNICNYKTGYICNFKRHLQSHTGEKLFKCNICNNKYSAKSYLKIHLRIHTGERPFECTMCNNKYYARDLLHKHFLRIHMVERRFKCNYCNYKCTEKSNLNRHMISHSHKKPLKCDQCNDKSVSKHNMHRHMVVHSGETSFNCEICKYKCKRKDGLKEHLKTHIANLSTVVCEICNYKFATRTALDMHMMIHNRKTPVEDNCKDKCTTERTLNQELVNHRYEEALENIKSEFTCSTTEDALNEHTVNHSEEEPCKCNICNYKGASKYMLRRHMVTHNSQKPFKGDHCNYRSGLEGKLQQHMMPGNSIPSTRGARILATIQNSASHKSPSCSENQITVGTAATLEPLQNNTVYESGIQNEDQNILLEDNLINLENVEFVYEQPDSTFTGGVDFPENDDSEIEKSAILKIKRVSDPDQWLNNKNKKLRMLGKEYVGYRKTNEDKIKHDIVRGKRKVKPTCASEFCKRTGNRFCRDITENRRNDIFNNFWMMTWKQKKKFVAHMVHYTEKKRTYVEGLSRRSGTYEYFLKMNGKKLQVCKKMFLNTLDIGEKTIPLWLNAAKGDGCYKTKNINKQ